MAWGERAPAQGTRQRKAIIIVGAFANMGAMTATHSTDADARPAASTQSANFPTARRGPVTRRPPPGPLLQRDFVWFLLLALLVLGAGLGLRHPWPADEPRFALLARTMVETGQYLFPQRGIELYADKPPLFMWLQVLAFRLTGNWNVAFLLPSLLAALGTLTLTFDLTRRLWGRRAARVAGFMLLFTVQFTYQSKRAQIDPVLVFFVTLSAYALLRYYLLQPQRRWSASGWFFAGIGVITKGVGVVALALIPLVWLARRWRLRNLPPLTTGRWQSAVGPLWFLLALSLWLVPMLWAVWQSGSAEHLAYARNILFGQTALRFVDPEMHRQPWWYFLQVIATGWLPLTLLLPSAAMILWRQARARGPDARSLLPLGWAALVLLFFSLSPGKRDMYILPALPMVCVGLAPTLMLLLRQPRVRWLLFGFLLLLALTLTTLSALAIFAEPGFETRLEAARGLTPGSDAPWWMLLNLGLIGLLAALIAGPMRALLGLYFALATIWIVGFGFWGFPLLDGVNSARTIMRQAGERIDPKAEIGLVGWREQNLLQADRPVTEFGFSRTPADQLQRGIAWLAVKPDQRWLFADASQLGDCVPEANRAKLGSANRRDWVLFRYAGVAAGCR